MNVQLINSSERFDILILHGIADLARERQTTVRHLFALEKYSVGHRFAYHYIGDPVTDALRSIPFDIVVLDVTFLCCRWARPRSAFTEVKKRYEWLQNHGAFIAAFPQDDYDHSDYLDEWLAELGVGALFTVLREHRKVLYPRLLARGTPIFSALTAYIDEGDIELYRTHCVPFRQRTIDVGYRVRRLPANFGRFGILKSELGRVFAKVADGCAKLDISDDPKDAIYGDLWPKFLGNCRFTLGSESGSSILDPKGEVRDRVEAYIANNAQASFDEIAGACLSPQDESCIFSAISPRIFEAAMAGCCPILVEGTYNGLIEKEEHFIPVKRDLSDIDAAVARLVELDNAEKMSVRFQDAILGNQDLRYQKWVPSVIRTFEQQNITKTAKSLSDWEFAFRLEEHRSAIRRHRAHRIAELEEQLRLLGNEAEVERHRLLARLAESDNPKREPEILPRPGLTNFVSRAVRRLLPR